jgi:Ni,Fe-hydrogenase III small subunit
MPASAAAAQGFACTGREDVMAREHGRLETAPPEAGANGRVLMVTGPVTKNMREALLRTYNATPDPKWVVAVGDCAANGGLFAGSYAVEGGVSNVVPVDLHIPGCPPRPVGLLKGLLALVEKA